jgi:hypothetical protein
MPIPICPFFRNPTGGIWSAESEDRRGISSPLHCERIAIRPAAGKRLDLPQSVSSGVYGAQKLHDLVTHFGRGFVLNPVAHIVDFEMSHETRKAGAEFFEGWIELPKPSAFPAM